MIRTLFRIAAALALGAMLSACNPQAPEENDPQRYDRVLLMVGLGYNNLSSDIRANINTLSSGYLPRRNEAKALLVFAHTSLSDYDFTTPNAPVLIRMYSKDGKAVQDTIKRYSPDTVAASGEALAEVFGDVLEMFPSDHYGMLFSSHSSGWVPAGYTADDEGAAVFSAGDRSMLRPKMSHGPYGNMPLPERTKSIGIQCHLSRSTQYSMNLDEFVNAIPMHLDYMIFDSCLMGCAEVVYGFKDKCDYLIASPTEILTDGFVYETLSSDLLEGTTPDLRAVAVDYFEYYRQSSGTIALYDCSGIDAVAEAVRVICEHHPSGLSGIRAKDVQSYNYSLDPFFYDLKDICARMGADEGELSVLEDTIGSCVIFKAATPDFLGVKIDQNNYSGMSMYLPNPQWKKLNDFYKSSPWNSATGLLD